MANQHSNTAANNAHEDNAEQATSEQAARDRALDEWRQQWFADIAERQQHRNKQRPSKVSQTDEDIQKVTLAVERLAVTDEDATQPGPVAHQSMVLQSATAHSNTAIEYYEQASELESRGRLGDALESYQKAFRLDPAVDAVMRRDYQLGARDAGASADARSASANTKSSALHNDDHFARFVQLGEDYEPRHSAAAGQGSTKRRDSPFDVLLSHLRHDQSLSLADSDSGRRSAFARLPSELLIRIAQHMALLDVRCLLRFGATARLPLTITHHATVWRGLCERSYLTPHISTTLPRKHESGHLEQQLSRYCGDWRLMFIECARLRMEGVYISTCYYIRQGLSEISFNQPVHMVTYYRYLRFFWDGTCLARLTTDEPASVVRALQPGLKAAGTMYGKWELSGDRVLVRAQDDQRPHLTYWMLLRVRSTARGRHNKLVWLDYYSTDARRDDDERTHYPLTNFKSYYFSRVASFVR